jgi:site-specific DNA-methyltransferase (adenine-specific)
MVIRPYGKNAKKHPGEQLAKIAASIGRFGFRQPVVVDSEGTIIVGHGRYEAARKVLGWRKEENAPFSAKGVETIPYVLADDLSPEEIAAYRLADNKLNESEWDMELVGAELEALPEELKLLTGFEDVLKITTEEGDFDGTPPETATTKLGEMYRMGEHVLLCGNSTKREDVERLMGGEKADMVFTSPPYNADTRTGEGDIFSSRKTKKLYGEGYSDDLDSNTYVAFAKEVLDICFDFTEGFIFWNVSYNANSRFEYLLQITERIPYLIEQICWKKSSTIPFKGSLMRDWEPVYLFSTHGQKLGLDDVVSNHWEISNINSQQENHKACYPVGLPMKGISLVKPRTRVVLDPFGGSGTTLIACEQAGRKCRMMELDPKYCDVIVARWEKLTGKKAILRTE